MTCYLVRQLQDSDDLFLRHPTGKHETGILEFLLNTTDFLANFNALLFANLYALSLADLNWLTLFDAQKYDYFSNLPNFRAKKCKEMLKNIIT